MHKSCIIYVGMIPLWEILQEVGKKLLHQSPGTSTLEKWYRMIKMHLSSFQWITSLWSDFHEPGFRFLLNNFRWWTTIRSGVFWGSMLSFGQFGFFKQTLSPSKKILANPKFQYHEIWRGPQPCTRWWLPCQEDHILRVPGCLPSPPKERKCVALISP